MKSDPGRKPVPEKQKSLLWGIEELDLQNHVVAENFVDRCFAYIKQKKETSKFFFRMVLIKFYCPMSEILVCMCLLHDRYEI